MPERIFNRPGMKLRRSHQIALSLFFEEVGSVDLTPAQLGALAAIRENAGCNQITLARILGYDRSTMSAVVRTLEARGLVERTPDHSDKRGRSLRLTDKVGDLIEVGVAAADRAHARLLEPLTAAQRAAFLEAMDILLTTFNGVTRAPMPGDEGEQNGGGRAA